MHQAGEQLLAGPGLPGDQVGAAAEEGQLDRLGHRAAEHPAVAHQQLPEHPGPQDVIDAGPAGEFGHDFPHVLRSAPGHDLVSARGKQPPGPGEGLFPRFGTRGQNHQQPAGRRRCPVPHGARPSDEVGSLRQPGGRERLLEKAGFDRARADHIGHWVTP
ncbi:MAG: hypothetical protein ACOYEV_08075, partial [Candidatus Nanopelagicales bacterium]